MYSFIVTHVSRNTQTTWPFNLAKCADGKLALYVELLCLVSVAATEEQNRNLIAAMWRSLDPRFREVDVPAAQRSQSSTDRSLRRFEVEFHLNSSGQQTTHRGCALVLVGQQLPRKIRCIFCVYFLLLMLKFNSKFVFLFLTFGFHRTIWKVLSTLQESRIKSTLSSYSTCPRKDAPKIRLWCYTHVAVVVVVFVVSCTHPNGQLHIH